MSKATRSLLILALALGALSAGCSTPDPEGRFDQFESNTEDRRAESDAGPVEGQRVDFSGDYLVAVATSLNPLKPLLIQATVRVDTEANTIDFLFQPLKTDTLPPAGVEPREDARTAAGAPITVEGVVFEEDGTFVVDLGELQVSGEANPLTGSDITTTLTLAGTVLSATSFCGDATGRVTVPIDAMLDGSTFGAIAAEDVKTAEIVGVCPEQENNDMPDAGEPEPEPEPEPEGPTGRCLADIFAGEFDLQFITDTQRAQMAPPTALTLTLTASDDEAVCYTGELTSNTDGSSIGTIDYVLEIEGEMVVHVSEFNIPPGANPLLPDGGKASIDLVSESWQPNGLCGTGTMSFKLFEPFALTSAGDFSILRKGDAELVQEGPGCAGLTRAEPCGFEALAGEWDLRFATVSGGSNLLISIETNTLSCLSGTLNSKLEEGVKLADLIFAVDAEAPDQVQINFRNFVIPPGANPILPNGGTADIVMESEQIGEGTFCGAITVNLFTPFVTASAGTFNAGTIGGNEPETEECP